MDNATSYTIYKQEIKKYIMNHFKPTDTVLDIGAGSGTYAILLDGYFEHMDAVEAFAPNIKNHKLENKYNQVFNSDIQDFEFEHYDLVIMGDILEHLTVEQAQKVLKYILPKCNQIIVAVPYMLEQEEVAGNVFEIHKQPDLTRKNMLERYPELEMLYGNQIYGYYIKKNSELLKEEKELQQKTLHPTLDLIIPCHNLEKYIGNCLVSLKRQKNNTDADRKIYFICDNCTDNTENIIRQEMKDSDWKYEIIEAHEGSAGGARNKGLEKSTADYIWFVDGDDWLVGEDSIDILLDCMVTDDMDIIQFKIRSNANPKGEFGSGTVWQAMFSKRLIGDYRFNDRQVGEDNDFCAEMWDNRNPKLGRIDLAPYFYNFPREDSLSDQAYGWWSNKKQTVVLCCTRNYYKYLYTWLYGYTRNNYYRKLYLFIEDDELNLPFINLEYINMNKLDILNENGENYNTGYSKASLIRLYLSSLLKEDKVLYLDTDLMVTDNLDELWDLDLKDYYAAGVIDQGAKTNLMTPNIPVDKNHYVNSGVLLFNLDKIRQDNKEQELDKFVNENKLYYPDQDTINAVFKDKILFLDNKYNSSLFTGTSSHFKIYHWAGGKDNWVYDREHSDLWTKMEAEGDKSFELKVNGGKV